MEKDITVDNPKWHRLLFFLFLGLGVCFRLSDLAARNLWTDEAWVALAALAPTPGEALELGRSTPPFYTLALWGLAQVCGGSEAVLRSLSLVFGTATVVLFWLLAARLVTSGAALLGLAVVSLSPVLVYFSKELKQYSGDAFFAVCLVYLAERLRCNPPYPHWLAFGLVALLALGFSHGAVFVLPVVLLSLWLAAPRRMRLRLMVLGTCLGVTAGGFYQFFYRHQVDPALLSYWQQDFPDFSGVIPFVVWLAGALARYTHYFFGDWGWTWGVPLTLMGLIVLWRQGPRQVLLYLAGPLFLAFLAAALHRYPFMGRFNGSRLLLFSAPFLYLALAVGIHTVHRRLWVSPHRWSALLLAGLMVAAVQPLVLLRENLHPRTNRQELKPLVTHLQANLQPRDWVYVYYHAIYPFKYYYREPLQRVCWGKSCVDRTLTLPAGLNQPPARFWLVAAHFQHLEEIQRFGHTLLGPEWHLAQVITRTKAALLLYTRKDQTLAQYPGRLPGPRQSGPADPAGEKVSAETPPPLHP
jgi:hypothetical protein